jgi:hypothetical protein
MGAIRLVTEAHVRDLETRLAVTASDSPRRNEFTAELTEARKHLAAKNEVRAAAARLGYKPNEREVTDEAGRPVKPGRGFVRKDPATGRWEGFSFEKVQAEVGHPGV